MNLKNLVLLAVAAGLLVSMTNKRRNNRAGAGGSPGDFNRDANSSNDDAQSGSDSPRSGLGTAYDTQSHRPSNTLSPAMSSDNGYAGSQSRSDDLLSPR